MLFLYLMDTKMTLFSWFVSAWMLCVRRDGSGTQKPGFGFWKCRFKVGWTRVFLHFLAKFCHTYFIFWKCSWERGLKQDFLHFLPCSTCFLKIHFSADNDYPKFRFQVPNLSLDRRPGLLPKIIINKLFITKSAKQQNHPRQLIKLILVKSW